MAEGLSRCFSIFSKHALRVSVCLIAFQALLVPPSWFFSCLLDGYVFELKDRLQLYGGLFGYKIQLGHVVPKHSIALQGNVSLQTFA